MVRCAVCAALVVRGAAQRDEAPARGGAHPREGARGRGKTAAGRDRRADADKSPSARARRPSAGGGGGLQGVTAPRVRAAAGCATRGRVLIAFGAHTDEREVQSELEKIHRGAQSILCPPHDVEPRRNASPR